MKSSPNMPLNLLICGHSPEQAEQVSNMLRNSGYRARVRAAASEADLRTMLVEGEVDLVLNPLQSGVLDTRGLVDLLNSSPTGAAVLATVPAHDPASTRQAMSEGARDAVTLDDSEHLRMVVAREFEYVSLRRAFRRSQAEREEIEARCDTLIGSTSDAICYVAEGMHLFANELYMEQLGYDSLEDLEAVPVMDTVGSDGQEQIKKLLKHHGDPSVEPSSVSMRLRRNDGVEFDARLDLFSAQYDGEPCVQVILRVPEAQQQEPKQEADQEVQTASIEFDAVEIPESDASGVRFEPVPDHELETAVEEMAEEPLSVDLASECQAALLEGRVKLDYQTIAGLHGSQTESWLMCPSLFDIDSARIELEQLPNSREAENVRRAIDRRLLEEAVGFIARNRAERKSCRCFVAVGVPAIKDPETVPHIVELLRGHEVPASALAIQVSMGDIMSESEAYARFSTALRGIQCKIAIDSIRDPETFRLITSRHEIDYAWIDGGLIGALASHPQEHDSMDGILEIAAEHSIQTIATGVDSAQTMATLFTLQVNFAHGEFMRTDHEVGATGFMSA